MRIAVIVVRSLLGLMFLFSSIAVLFNLISPPPMSGNVKLFNEALAATGYFITFLKVIELICGVALISGFFTPLVTIIIFPITVHIFLYHAFMFPQGMVIAIFMLVGNLFLAYHYRKIYAPLFLAK